MIDIHFHCLPAVDDGPRDWDEAVALCKAAAADGSDTIVATPHVLREMWINDDAAARDELLLKLNELVGGKPTVLPGCEFFVAADAVELWQKPVNGPLTGLNRTSYLLVEFPATQIPKEAEAVIYELTMIGVTPVIAHPERNRVFATETSRLERLVGFGAITQVTAGSITGLFGKRAQMACDDLFDRGLVHVIASDAHSTLRRPPQMSEARDAVRASWGAEPADALFDANPRAIIEGKPIPWTS